LTGGRVLAADDLPTIPVEEQAAKPEEPPAKAAPPHPFVPAFATAQPSELVAKKAQAIYDAGLTVVHCVGEKLEERDAGTVRDGLGADRRSAGGDWR